MLDVLKKVEFPLAVLLICTSVLIAVWDINSEWLMRILPFTFVVAVLRQVVSGENKLNIHYMFLYLVSCVTFLMLGVVLDIMGMIVANSLSGLCAIILLSRLADCKRYFVLSGLLGLAMAGLVYLSGGDSSNFYGVVVEFVTSASLIACLVFQLFAVLKEKDVENLPKPFPFFAFAVPYGIWAYFAIERGLPVLSFVNFIACVACLAIMMRSVAVRKSALAVSTDV